MNTPSTSDFNLVGAVFGRIGVEGLTARELSMYRGPSPSDLLDAGCEAVVLGHYFPWDPDETARAAACSPTASAPRPMLVPTTVPAA